MDTRRQAMGILADILTASRLVIAGALVLLGLLAGREAFPTAVILLIAGWTTDSLDGMAARAAPPTREVSWWGEHDYPIDVLMVFCAGVYLTLAGFIPTRYFIAYVALALVLTLLTRAKSVLMLLETPLVFYPVYLSFQMGGALAWAWVLWGLAFLIIDGRRFIYVVQSFIEDAGRLLRRILGQEKGNAAEVSGEENHT